jgi:hypothetical protein
MNKNISSIHLELLDKTRQVVFKKIIPFATGFVLGGGTALSLQLAHRKSFDFDFFSSSELPKNLLEKLSREFAVENIVVDTSSELTFFTKDSVKITFLYYPFKALFTHSVVANKLHMFSVREIAQQKAYTIGRRGEYRDYFDLYTILKRKYISLNELIKSAKHTYNGAFDEKLFLEQLVYYDDLRSFEITSGLQVPLPTPEEIKQYFENLAKTYLR